MKMQDRSLFRAKINRGAGDELREPLNMQVYKLGNKADNHR